MKYLITTAFLVVCVCALCTAQSAPATNGQIEAATELANLALNQQVLDSTISEMIKAQAATNPILNQFEDVMRTFLSKYMSVESIRPGTIKIYVDNYSEAEIRDLIAFYKTPTGAKTLRILPKLARMNGELAQQLLKDHQQELKDAITKRLDELEAKEPKP